MAVETGVGALRVLRVVSVALLVLAMASARVYVGGLRENAKARESLAAGDVTEAITAYDRSLHWYLPGSPTVREAAASLIDIAHKSEYEKDLDTALRSWRVLRSGFYAATWLTVPGQKIIAQADTEIARLVGVAAELVRPGSGPEAQMREMAILKAPVGPNPAWSSLAVLAFFGWIASVVGFIFRAFGPTDEFFRRPAVLWGFLFVTSYALWMISLARA